MRRDPSPAGAPRGVALAVVALALLWCVGLFARGYWTPDEPREAALSSSMVTQLQPLPVLAGQRFAEKPPLTYWLAGLAQRAFGASPAMARLPQLGYAILAFLAVLSLARRLLGGAGAANREAPWIAALLFASGALACQVQAWLDTDALLLAGVCVALAGMHAGLAATGAAAPARRARLRGYLTMHAGLALAFFAKNFAGWLVPVLAFLCFVAWERRWRELWRWELYVGGLLVSALIIAWVGAVVAQPDGARSVRVLFLDNILGRALPLADTIGETYSGGHPNRPGKYLLELPAYLFPWTFLVAGSLAAARRTLRARRDAALGTAGAGSGPGVRAAWRFALCAALPGLAVLSLAATARSIYAAPCLPGFALLAGLWSADGARAGSARWPLLATKCLIASCAVVMLALTAALQWTVVRAGGVVLLSSLVACAVAFGTVLFAREWARLVAAWCLLLSIGGLAVLGAVDRMQDIAGLATRVAQAAAPGPLLLWDPDETTLAWAQLYLPEGSWSAVAAADKDAAMKLAHQLQSVHGTVVVSLVRGRGWSAAKWREYLRPHTSTTSLSMMPPSQAAREPLLAAARLSVTTRVERPGGRSYLLWRLRP